MYFIITNLYVITINMCSIINSLNVIITLVCTSYLHLFCHYYKHVYYCYQLACHHYSFICDILITTLFICLYSFVFLQFFIFLYSLLWLQLCLLNFISSYPSVHIFYLPSPVHMPSFPRKTGWLLFECETPLQGTIRVANNESNESKVLLEK